MLQLNDTFSLLRAGLVHFSAFTVYLNIFFRLHCDHARSLTGLLGRFRTALLLSEDRAVQRASGGSGRRPSRAVQARLVEGRCIRPGGAWRWTWSAVFSSSAQVVQLPLPIPPPSMSSTWGRARAPTTVLYLQVRRWPAEEEKGINARSGDGPWRCRCRCCSLWAYTAASPQAFLLRSKVGRAVIGIYLYLAPAMKATRLLVYGVGRTLRWKVGHVTFLGRDKGGR